MSLKVSKVVADGPQFDVYIQGDSLGELGDEHAYLWRKLAVDAVAGIVGSPMIRSSEYYYADAEGRPLENVTDMESLRAARPFRKVAIVAGGGGPRA